VPSAADGARQYGERLGGEEVASEHGGKSGVLHAHLNRDGTLLGGVEAGASASQPTEAIAQGVVAEYYGESPEEEHQATSYQVVVNGRDNASYDECQAGDAHARHQALNGREAFLLTIDIIEGATDGNRDDGYDEDVDEHSDGIHVYDLACRNLHQERSHHWGEDGGGAGHTHGERYVAMAEVTHDIARYTARTAAYQEDTQRQCWVEVPYVNQGVSHTWHDDELGTGSDEHIQWTLSQNLKVVGGQGQSHREHDDAENDGLGCSAHPVEGMWEEECEYCYTYDKDGGVIS